jgi:hemoglobin-like flavoprotein
MKREGMSAREETLTPPRPHRGALHRVLERLAEQESGFCERFYCLFFARCPDAVPLFGVHSIAEREEMIHETFRSLHAYCDGEPWLGDNLDALGRSHAEYGVTEGMYDAYCDVWVDCSREVMDPKLTDSGSDALKRAIFEICQRMLAAAESPTSIPTRLDPNPSMQSR